MRRWLKRKSEEWCDLGQMAVVTVVLIAVEFWPVWLVLGAYLWWRA